MGERHFIICRDCKYTNWLEDHELTDFINDHSGHKITIFPSDVLEDQDSFEEVFRKFMDWPTKGE